MTSLHVPPEAAKWIISMQRFRPSDYSAVGKDELVRIFSNPYHGLGYFLVRDLKYIWDAMQRFQFVIRSHYRRVTGNNRKKAEFIQLIRRYFYSDIQCTIPDPAAMKELEEATADNLSNLNNNDHPNPCPPAAPAAAAVPSCRPGSIPLLPKPTAPLAPHPFAAFAPKPCDPTMARYQQAQPQFAAGSAAPTGTMCTRPSQSQPTPLTFGVPNMISYPNYCPKPMNQASNAAVASGGGSSGGGSQSSHLNSCKKRLHSGALSTAVAGAAWPVAPAPSTISLRPNSLSSSGHCSHGHQHLLKKIKREPDYDETPQNDRETKMLGELRQMGFTDKREILNSIRKLGMLATSSESVMIDIITTREDAAEARKMDEARLLSEQSRKEESRRRRLIIASQFQKEIQTSSIDVWTSKASMFRGSVVLGGSIKKTLNHLISKSESLKNVLLSLLDLEKKARKFYKSLPVAYFAQLSQRLARIEASDDELVRTLESHIKSEIEAIEVGMYTLSEQQGGVPRIFVEAHDRESIGKKAARELQVNAGNDGSDEDDEVEVVLVQVASHQDKEDSPLNEMKQAPTPDCCEVIEIS